MTIWTVANQKGGVGKTTTAVTMAGLMHERDRRQLLVDLDPHASLTSYFGRDPDSPGSNAYTIFANAGEGVYPDPRPYIARTPLDGVDLLPASPALATVERRFGTRAGMGRVVKQSLGLLKQDYDDIWVDCPPTLGILMINALAACEYLIIPVQTEYLALKGLERMFSSLELVERSLGINIPRVVVPTMYDRRTRASIDALHVLKSRYGDCLWPEPVPVDTRFRFASEQGRPLSQLKPDSRGITAYRSLLDHLMTCKDRGRLAS